MCDISGDLRGRGILHSGRSMGQPHLHCASCSYTWVMQPFFFFFFLEMIKASFSTILYYYFFFFSSQTYLWEANAGREFLHLHGGHTALRGYTRLHWRGWKRNTGEGRVWTDDGPEKSLIIFCYAHPLGTEMFLSHPNRELKYYWELNTMYIFSLTAPPRGGPPHSFNSERFLFYCSTCILELILRWN